MDIETQVSDQVTALIRRLMAADMPHQDIREFVHEVLRTHNLTSDEACWLASGLFLRLAQSIQL